MAKEKKRGERRRRKRRRNTFSTVLERLNNKNLTKYNLKINIMTTFIFILTISLKVPLECTSGLHGL